ncbi:MAG: shikimate dehydrogenase [Saprospiraceae bacterium]|nr:shikimate dehydrogenase [Saprospiraceae bacterium]
MAHFGLIGKSLKHSFSKTYFESKWARENIFGHEYTLYELENESALDDFLKREQNLHGLNVTIPYKTSIIKYIHELTETGMDIQAVNCLRKMDGAWIGHNTDADAFLLSLENFLPSEFPHKALVLGSGGASQAVRHALKIKGIGFQVVSSSGKGLSYEHLRLNWDPAWKLIINTSPLGMFPDVDACPDLPYDRFDESFYLMDLVYNPEKTLFLTLGAERACHIKNGLEMLHLQAELSWLFWNQ